MAGQVALNKKQGVSGQSVSVSNNINIDKVRDEERRPERPMMSCCQVEKDFHTRTLIKEAIEDNDFLKNLSASQVRSSLYWNLAANIMTFLSSRCSSLLTLCMKKRYQKVAT